MQAEQTYEATAMRATSASQRFSSTRILLLVFVYAAGLLLFLGVEPTKPWILMLVTAFVALGTDGIVRMHPRAPHVRDVVWTAPYLLLPSLLALAAGLFFEDTLSGYRIVAGVVVAGLLMAAMLYATYASVDASSPKYATARFILNLGAFLTAFAFYAVVYSFDIDVVPSALIVGLISLLLAVEVLRESEAEPVRALVFAGAIGVIVAQARWALYFLPLDDYLAGVFLLLVFYLTSGILQHHLNDDLRRPVVTEFAAITVAGVIIVTLGRVFESGA